jgi:acyl-CoA synthetase (NDP forming)
MNALGTLLSPASIAVIGASADRTRIRGRLFHQIAAAGFAGPLYPITTSVSAIEGHRSYPSVAAVGAPIDLAVIATPPDAVLDVLEGCAAARVRSALVLTSGFAEQGGDRVAVQQRISALARESGMRICGPNSVGFYNVNDRVAATFSPAVGKVQRSTAVAAVARRVGVISQSGGMGFTFLDYGAPLGLGFSTLINTGNEADVTASDLLLFMAQDAATDVIVLFLEGIRDPARFLEAAAAAQTAGKPVVVCKIGRSTAAARAARSHTANMTGWDAAYDAAFRRFGMIIAHDPEEMTAVAAALATCPPAAGNRVAVITVSGGAGALMCDALAAEGLALPFLSEAMQARLRPLMPSYGSPENPVDVTAAGAFDGELEQTVTALAECDEVDAIVIVLSLAGEDRVSFEADALRAVVARQIKPILCYSYTRPSPLACATAASAGLVVNLHLTWTARAMRALVERGRQRAAVARPVLASPVTAPLPLALTGPVCEYQARLLLSPVVPPSGQLVSDRAFLRAAGEAEGWPVAMKIQSPDIQHKTDVGGVALGIGSSTALEVEYDAMMARVARHAPGAAIHGVLVQKMAAKGLEMIVSAIDDPVFGPVMMVGAGGVTAELYKDVSYRLAPLDEAEAAEMLKDLRSAPLLRGWRRAPAADIPALARLVADLSRFAVANRAEAAEIELNPVLVHPMGQGLTVVDALLTPAATA